MSNTDFNYGANSRQRFAVIPAEDIADYVPEPFTAEGIIGNNDPTDATQGLAVEDINSEWSRLVIPIRYTKDDSLTERTFRGTKLFKPEYFSPDFNASSLEGKAKQGYDIQRREMKDLFVKIGGMPAVDLNPEGLAQLAGKPVKFTTRLQKKKNETDRDFLELHRLMPVA